MSSIKMMVLRIYWFKQTVKTMWSVFCGGWYVFRDCPLGYMKFLELDLIGLDRNTEDVGYNTWLAQADTEIALRKRRGDY